MREPNLWKSEKDFYLNVLVNPWYKLLVKLENLVSMETMKFYEEKGIITMHLPVTTGSISSPMGRGSDSLPVKVNLEGIDTYLADSMQFLLEYGCRLNEKGVYYVMPSFRGEKADERHLCQFYHSEAEIPGNLEDVINLVEEYVKYLSKKILENFKEELEKAIGDVSHIEKIANYKGNFPRITFNQAEQALKEKFGDNLNDYIEYNDGWRNITRKAEQELIKIYDGIVWITNYDILAVPFYQKFDNDLAGTTKNADLLFGIGETVGCGERHQNDMDLLKSMKLHEVDKEEYEWYIKLKEKYPLQTAGFGMGIERYLMWVLKASDIRNMQICLRFNGKNILP
uniref:asparagine synthetase A n=1 Tax=Candidatus Onthocola sp. TaxID=3085646 RepID=UPI003FEFE839